jgi:hypothetical protein
VGGHLSSQADPASCPLCVRCRVRPVQNRGPVLSGRPLDALLRDVRAECYRYGTEIGPIDTPCHVLLVAAIHEGAQATTALVLENLDQLDLPKSRPVLSELWEEVREYRRFYRRNYEALKRSFALACNRVLRPRMVAEEEVVESWRASERLGWEPKPLMTLMGAFLGAPHLADPDRHTQQVLERCPLLRHLIASRPPFGASQMMMTTEVSQALRESCPSAQELWSRILNRHAVDAQERDDPARYREPLTPSELNRGLCAAFLLGPVLESVEVINMRFEESAVRLLAEKVDELFAMPLPLALAAPLHAVLPVEASKYKTPEAPNELPDLVTLDQAAAAPASGTEARPPSDSATVSWPKGLDSQAVGIAHEMLEKDGWINVAEVARRLGEERTKLYRSCPAFSAMVRADRQAKTDRKAEYLDGPKHHRSRRQKCASDD